MHYQLSHLHKSSPAYNEAVGKINAIRLAQLNARTRTIRALTGLSQGKAKQVILEINNRNPPRGRGVESLEDYINNKAHRRHVSYIIQTYRNAINLGISHVESVIHSYQLYLESFATHADKRTFVDVDHAFFLIMETNKRADFDLFDCECCKSKFFYHRYELHKACPFCTDKREVQMPQKDQTHIDIKAA